jgi:hypothetical protein
LNEKIYILGLQIFIGKGDLMIKTESLQKNLAIAALTGLMMLFLAGFCSGQVSLDTAGTGSCKSCSSGVPADQAAPEASSLNASEDTTLIINLPDVKPGMQPGNSSPLYPVGLISDPRPIFNWTAVPNAAKYNLQVYNNNSIVASESFHAKNVTQDDLCSASLSVYLPDDVYFWHVQACNLEGCGNWSQWQYFENICALKPDETREQTIAGGNDIRLEKGTMASVKENIESKREMAEAKMIAAKDGRKIDLNGGQRSGCNCGSTD